MVANPLLGSALTAPKRKRGRPRKLSGSSNGPNTPGEPTHNEEENNDQEMRLHHPNRPDSPCKQIFHKKYGLMLLYKNGIDTPIAPLFFPLLISKSLFQVNVLL